MITSMIRLSSLVYSCPLFYPQQSLKIISILNALLWRVCYFLFDYGWNEEMLLVFINWSCFQKPWWCVSILLGFDIIYNLLQFEAEVHYFLLESIISNFNKNEKFNIPHFYKVKQNVQFQDLGKKPQLGISICISIVTSNYIPKQNFFYWQW